MLNYVKKSYLKKLFIKNYADFFECRKNPFHRVECDEANRFNKVTNLNVTKLEN